MGRPSYSPPINILIPRPSTEIPYCSRGCGSAVELTPDAIGRLRERCPKCDGVARAPFVRPGEVRRTQAIDLGGAALPPGVYRLPPIEPDQLRCQVCACGVPISIRICKPCVAARRTARAAARPKPAPAPQLCRACHVNPVRAREGKFGRAPQRCDACEAHRASLSKTPCACGREKPKGRIKCDVCLTRPTTPKTCRRCGGTEQLRHKKQLCDACNPPIARGTIREPVFKPKVCARCTTPFTPTGPRQTYCRRPECLAA